MGLFYYNKAIQGLVGYADARYLLDSHKARSQTSYVFTYRGIAISWCSMKHTTIATSSNHVELLALHKASKVCIWLRPVAQHIQGTCGLFLDEKLIMLYKDNASCLAQLEKVFTKSKNIRHISSKFFFTQDNKSN